MEGTRHEKAVMVIVSYVLGFTTAFIAFGVNEMYGGNISGVQIDSSSLQIFGDNTISDSRVKVGFTEEGLFAVTKHYNRLLSANKNVLSASAISSVDASGFHYSISDAKASDDGQFIYFCEQVSKDSEDCYPYVYSLIQDAVHPVRVNGKLLEMSVLNTESSWSGNSYLTLTTFSSINADEPWMLQ